MGPDVRIDNEVASAVSGAAYKRKSPMTGETATSAAAGKSADAEHAAPPAVAEISTWAATGPSRRRTNPYTCADILEARSGKFVSPGAGESCGRRPRFGYSVLPSANNMLREAAAIATRITDGFVHSDTPDTLATGCPQPVDVFVGLAFRNASIPPGAR